MFNYRGLNDDEWPVNAATKDLLNLQELEGIEIVENENNFSIIEDESYEYEAGKDPMVSVLDPLILDASESEDGDDEGKTDAEVARTNSTPFEEGQHEMLHE